MDISKTFLGMNIIAGCKKPVKLMDETKKKIDEKPEQAKEITIKFRHDIDCWFNRIIIISIIVLLILIFLAIILFYFKIYRLFLGFVFIVFHVILYIIDRCQNKYGIKKKLNKEIDDYAIRNGIYYVKVFGY